MLKELNIHIEKKFKSYLAPSTKFNSKWIISLNMRPKTIELLEKTGENFCDFRLGRDLSEKSKSTNDKINTC